ncbi:MAG: hypothetical protein M3271_07735 [Actinomycetota bacterium]|nr:hypothetical protein [Actinomycetota bacterium]
MSRPPDERADQTTSSPLGSWSGYARTAAGGALGALAGGAIGFLRGSQLEGDPSAGLGNIALIAAGILLIALLALAGAAVGTYLALRMAGELAAGTTAFALLLVAPPLGWTFGSSDGFGFLAGVLGGSLLARLLAVRVSRGGAIERFALVGVIGVVWLLPYLPSAYREIQDSRLQSTGFQLFGATRLPGDQELTLVHTADGDTDHPWVKLEYGSPGDMVMLLEYEDFGRYSPPSNCGPEHPGASPDLPRPCEKVYTTAQGYEVFRSSLANTAYVKIGATIITTSWGSDGVKKVLDSLRPMDRGTLLGQET